MPCQVSIDKLVPPRRFSGKDFREFTKSARCFPESDLEFWATEITNCWWIEREDLHFPEEFDSAS